MSGWNSKVEKAAADLDYATMLELYVELCEESKVDADGKAFWKIMREIALEMDERRIALRPVEPLPEPVKDWAGVADIAGPVFLSHHAALGVWGLAPGSTVVALSLSWAPST